MLINELRIKGATQGSSRSRASAVDSKQCAKEYQRLWMDFFSTGRIVLIYKLSVRHFRHLGGGEEEKKMGRRISDRSTVNQVEEREMQRIGLKIESIDGWKRIDRY